MAEPQAPEPDDKDWTWTLQRPCPECGFDTAAIEPVAIPALVRDAASRWPDVLARPDAATRPAPTTWSPLEYACHVRDVHRLFQQRLELMLRGVVAARQQRYVMLNASEAALPAIRELLPGLGAPSVLPLAEPGQIAVHAAVDVDEIWDLLPPLKAAGASSILVVPVERLVP